MSYRWSYMNHNTLYLQLWGKNRCVRYCIKKSSMDGRKEYGCYQILDLCKMAANGTHENSFIF